MATERTYTAFIADRRVASGALEAVVQRLKELLDAGETGLILIFEDQTGRQVDFDLRGTPEDVLARLPHHPLLAAGGARPGPGRPRLGVVSREVSLLPRHWEWLEEQENGISAALRRLVDEARKREPGKERARRARNAASAVMTALAGDRPGFEEASRALFAGDRTRFAAEIRDWPPDVRDHLTRLVEEADRLETATLSP